MDWWIKAPDGVGFWWWRENASDTPIVRHIKQDKLGLYDANFSGVNLSALGGEWQAVAPWKE
jgi:hypothetical protein